MEENNSPMRDSENEKERIRARCAEPSRYGGGGAGDQAGQHGKEHQ